MMTKQINFVATIALVLGLLLVASPAYSCPFQETITLPAIGVGPIQPKPVQEVPAPQPGTVIIPSAPIGATPIAIGVGPVPMPQPQPQPQPLPPQPQPIGPPLVVPGDYVPVQPMPVNPVPQPAFPPVIPHQPGSVVYPGVPQPVKVVDSKNFNEQRALAGLQDLLNQQAALGQYPHNNKVLSDLSAVVAKHSQQTPSSKVRVVNSGPGTLRVTHANGSTTDVRPNFSLEIDVKSAKIHLSAQFENALITLANVSGLQAKFWDQDDNRHTGLGISQQHHFTLTPGVWGHHLTQ